MLNNTTNQQIRFKKKNWVEINDDARGTYNSNNQTTFKPSMLKSSLCDYIHPYIFASGTIIVSEVAAGVGNNNIEVLFKNCAPFTHCKSEISNTQKYNAKKTSMR